jgi:hypothetical protein
MAAAYWGGPAAAPVLAGSLFMTQLRHADRKDAAARQRGRALAEREIMERAVVGA